MFRTEDDKIDNEGEGFISSQKVLVIGDVILDEFVFGTSSRISPEAPVPIMSETGTDFRAGGAANVALNCQNLGLETTLVGITGRDNEADILVNLLNGLAGLHVQKENLHTTLKTRFIVDGQHVLRIDREDVVDKNDCLKYVLNYLPGNKWVIVADYGKHFTGMIPKIITAGSPASHIIVDPKSSDWSIYRHCSTITPNQKEFVAAGGDLLRREESCEFLRKKFEIDNILLTLGAGGLGHSSDAGYKEMPAVSQKVVDVTGAGDTVVSAFVSGLSGGMSVEGSMELANVAAGIVCHEEGTAVVERDDLRDYGFFKPVRWADKKCYAA